MPCKEEEDEIKPSSELWFIYSHKELLYKVIRQRSFALWTIRPKGEADTTGITHQSAFLPISLLNSLA